MTAAPALLDAFFRREYGRLVAALCHRVGVQHLEAVEDAVGAVVVRALERWPEYGRPENPAAWLTRAANNELIGQLRKRSRRAELLAQNFPARAVAGPGPSPTMREEVDDELLRMLFACCAPSLPWKSQLVFALKTLCGFTVSEIGHRLFTTEANVYKRIQRARRQLREEASDGRGLEVSPDHYAQRLPAVSKMLYTMFTEGHLSSHPEAAVRREPCDEAMRLTLVLVQSRAGQTPETMALVALMHLHLARWPGRQTPSGGLLLLEEQDRSLWDRELMGRGLAWLAQSAQGGHFSRYHGEAGIAAEHCLAPSFAETDWQQITEYYLMLEQVTSSPLHRLNRALAVAEWKGPAAALSLLREDAPPSWLEGSYLWSATLSDLYGRHGDAVLASRYRTLALDGAPSDPVRHGLAKRLNREI